MPFSLGQILGGWGRKGRASAIKVARRDARAVRSKSTFDVESTKTSNVFQERGKHKEVPDEKRVVVSATPKGKSDLAWEVMRSPHISEKGSASGEGLHIFKVVGGANKLTVKRAIEDRYGVEVDSVRMANMPAKQRRRGQVLGERPGFKKAIVCLKEGQNISEF